MKQGELDFTPRGLSTARGSVSGMILTRAQALKLSGRTYVTLKIPELDGELRISSLSAGAAIRYAELEARQAKGEEIGRQIMLFVLETAVVDEEGNVLFDAPSAASFLDTVSFPSLLKIVHAIPRTADSDAPKATERAEDPSKASPSAA